MKCAIYTRVSTSMQANKEYNSCEAQRDRILSYIKSQDGLEVYREYSDPGFSASTIDRPAFTDLLNDIKQRKIDAVLTYKIDRLTRSSKDFYNLIEYFDKYGVNYISVSERFDTSSAAGRLLRNIMLTFAQFEREMTSERIRDKFEQRAKKGYWNGGGVPIGFKSVSKRLVPDGRWASKIKSIFENFVSTGSLFETMAILRSENTIHPRSNKPISLSSVAYILRNPIYTGKIRWNDTVLPGEHKPIISEELFDHAQTLMKKRVRKKRVYKEFLLSGLVKCSSCGFTMTNSFTNKKGGRYYYYRCTSTMKGIGDCPVKQVNAQKLEAFLIDYLLRISQDADYLESISLKQLLELPDQLGFELARSSSKTLANRVQQVLITGLEKIQRGSQVEKCLHFRNLLREIKFSRETMELYVVLRDTHKSARLDVSEDAVGAAAARVREGRPDRPTSPWSPGLNNKLAEGVGFEPTRPFGLTVFKTAAIDHSAIPPEKTFDGEGVILTHTQKLFMVDYASLINLWQKPLLTPRSSRTIS